MPASSPGLKERRPRATGLTRSEGSTPIGNSTPQRPPGGGGNRGIRGCGAGPAGGFSGRDGVRVVPVENRFFGGTTAVAGLLVGEDIARTLADQPEGHRYLLPDVCLSQGMFLDGTRPADLPRPVEVVPSDGAALRRALDG